MKKSIQTLLVRDKTNALREYPVRDRGDTLESLKSRFSYSRVVYGYILNRKPKFKHRFYGWALPR